MTKASTTKKSTNAPSRPGKTSQPAKKLSAKEQNDLRSQKEFDKLAKAETKGKGSTRSTQKKSLATKTGTSPLTKPFRDLEINGITYSFLAKFLGCREQARLQYVEGLQRTGTIEAIDFGSCFHELLEHFAEGSTCDQKSLKKKLDGWLADQKKYRQLQGYEFQKLFRLAEQVLMIFPIYLDYWKQQKGHEFRSDFVCQEQDFRLQQEIPWQGSTRGVTIRGRFDAIFRLKGRLWLMENKTKGLIDEEGITASLALDLQTMLYCRAIEMMYGEKPEGLLYNVIRRPALRQGKTETYQAYLDRIYRDIMARQSYYFMRWQVTFAKQDVDKWVQQTLNPLLSQVCLWWDEIKDNPFNPFENPNRVHHFTNPEGLYSRFGRSEFFELLTRNSMHGLSRRTR